MTALPMRKGFTLIELLIVIAIVAVLAIVVIVTLNPAQLLAQGRDSTRLSDLTTLNTALAAYTADASSLSLGTSSTVYVSLPDTSSTCGTWSLPALPAGYTYGCATSSTYRSVDGTGWIPVNFASFSSGSPLSQLPVDPINTSSTGRYYVYVPGATTWELNGFLESQKYHNVANISKTNLPGLVAIGTNLGQSPIANTSGLAAYWPMDEGTGTITADRSGNNNNGTLVSGPTWQGSSNCKVGGCISLDGVDDYIQALDSASLRVSNITASFWVSRTTNITYGMYLTKNYVNSGPINTGWYQILNNAAGGNLQARITSDGSDGGTTPVIPLATWSYITLTHDGTTARWYVNGILVSSVANAGVPVQNGVPLYIGRRADGYFNNVTFDDMRIYNRALAPAEVMALYNATR